MIISLYTKTLLAPPNTKLIKPSSGFEIVRYDNPKSEHYSFNILSPHTMEEYNFFRRMYTFYDAPIALQKHYELFENYWKSILDIPDIPSSEYLEEYTNNGIHVDPKLIPAEYMVNMVNISKIAHDKFNFFRVGDIIAEILKLGIRQSNEGKSEIVELLKMIYNNHPRMKLRTILLFHPEVELEIKNVFENNGLDLALFTDNLVEYIDLNTCMGYSRMGLFKYNKFLANEIRDTGFILKDLGGN